MNTTAKRNKFRGLQAYVAEHYDVAKHSPDAIHAALQDEERWAGVSLDSVKTAVSVLRRETGASGRYRKTNGVSKANLPNVLITIPLPKRQSATMTVAEAYVVFKVLRGLFEK